jgi:glutathione S-transferase
LSESGAIIEYLLAKHGGGRLVVSADRPEFPDYLFWLHFANGSLMPSLMVDIILALTGTSNHDTLRRLRARGDRAFDLIEKTLGSRSYFAGSSLTAADIIMLFPLTTMRHFVPRDLSPYPSIRSYLKRIGDRPPYQRAMKKADPALTPLLD